ncbi:hypothetical protein K5P26_07960 [Sphingopyxis sp. XHP0097]|uniref:Uncharacterized protein n=1 Tax=Sphingopyxis jiangsuensis TaxID=2871171 RepID=A0ABS7MEI0_9SPHN|nr:MULTISPECIES: hypothetical protein [Sphingopyxis]MBY4637069.1 hypothetical protein [Sphingopyxis jiangsuensis]
MQRRSSEGRGRRAIAEQSVRAAWLFVAPALFIEQSLEVAFFDQGPHRSFGAALFKLLT